MTGYFSRLIQQSGIALGTHRVPSVPRQSFGDLESDRRSIDSLASDTLENNESIATDREQENELGETTTIQSINFSNSGLPVGNVLDTKAILPRQDRANLPDATLASEEDISSQLFIEKTQEVTEASSKNSLNLTDRSDFFNSGDRPKELVKENTTNSQKTAFKEIFQSPIDPARELPEVRLQEYDDRQPTAITQDSKMLPSDRVNFQTVREWVSKTPEENLHPQSPIPHSPLPITQKPNFTLLIGTISLTIEAAKTEIQQPKTPSKKSDRTVQPSPPTSRMNRHYIRLR